MITNASGVKISAGVEDTHVLLTAKLRRALD